MRHLIISVLLLTCTCILHAQVNKVINPSFEQHWRCPTDFDQIRFANFWSTIDTINTYPSLGDSFSVPNCAPDYINTCATGNYDVGAPVNSRFYQYSRSGNGMAQVVMFFDESYNITYKRDYLQGRLYSNLTAGMSYCITFFVNFEGNIAGIPSGYAVDHIGAYLDNGAIDQDTGMNYCGLPHPSIIPQVYTTTIITDTVNWTMIQGSFTATGAEKFITIGNFFDKVHTNYFSYSNGDPFAIYLVDDVSVIESDAVANAGPDAAIGLGDSVHIGTSDEGMPETWYIQVGEHLTPIGYSGGIWVQPDTTTTYIVEMDLCGHVTYDTMTVYVWPLASPRPSPVERVLLYPNPTTGNVTIEHAEGAEVTISDVMGRSVGLTMTIKSEKETINIEGLHEGVYVVQIVDPSSGYKTTRKIIKE